MTKHNTASITADRRAMPGHSIDTVNIDSKCRVQEQVAPARSTAVPSVQILARLYAGRSTWLNDILTYLLQSPSCEANWFAASQEIPRILWNPKVHYRIHKLPPPVPILG